MKSQGFSQRKVEKMTGYGRGTIRKYWDMTPDKYEEILAVARKSSLDQHKEMVLMWLRDYPEITAAQVFDWLLERYKVTISESSVRRYVRKLRIEYNIKRSKEPREYQAIADPPMGQQMQIDIGIVSVENVILRKHQKLYCIGFVLSNSRYKYGVWYDKPPTAIDMVNAIQACFEWMGGKPKELVFDQDRLIAVSENYGDVIYTKEFENFRQNEKLQVYLCRSADPESKGKVEAIIKYFKNNFAKYRPYSSLKYWEEEFCQWLDRCGNSKKHGMTKKIPAEVFEVEREYLVPVVYKTNSYNKNSLTRTIRKDNTVFYLGNRYTVPLGSYNKHKEAELVIQEETLQIYDVFQDALLAEHKICLEKGKLIQNRHHLRRTEVKINKIKDSIIVKLNNLIGDNENTERFLESIRREKPRYARDQYQLIEKTIAELDSEAILLAINFCCANELYSAVDFRDAARHYNSSSKPIAVTDAIVKAVAMPQKVFVSKRDISEYLNKLGGHSQCPN